jgi:hypothetical protein
MNLGNKLNRIFCFEAITRVAHRVDTVITNFISIIYAESAMKNEFKSSNACVEIVQTGKTDM